MLPLTELNVVTDASTKADKYAEAPVSFVKYREALIAALNKESGTKTPDVGVEYSNLADVLKLAKTPQQLDNILLQINSNVENKIDSIFEPWDDFKVKKGMEIFYKSVTTQQGKIINKSYESLGEIKAFSTDRNGETLKGVLIGDV